ncbi:MAG: tetratricopeptide repeat protein, partial [Planctomycetales bacterium]
MRRFNTKFCVSLTVSIVILGVAMAVAWVINYDRSMLHLLETAQTAHSQGDSRLALDNYRKYLLQKPEDSQRVCEAAVLAAEFIKKDKVTRQELIDAIKLMNSALVHSADRNDIRRELIDFHVSFRDFHRAGKLIAEFEQYENLSPELEFIDAKCASQSGAEVRAMDRLSRLIGYSDTSQQFDVSEAVAPQMVDAYKLLADIHWQRGDVVSKRFADAVMDQMVLANPDSAEVFLLQGRYLLARTGGIASNRSEQLKIARQHLNSALELDPENHEAMLELATVAMEVSDFAKARDILKNARQQAPEDPNVYVKQAQLAEYQGDSKVRMVRLQEGLEVLPDNSLLLSMLLDTQQAHGMP